MSTPWRRHCSPKIAGASLWNHVPNSEVGRLFCFFFAARRPSQLLSTYYDCRQLVQLSAHLCLQHVGRAVERRSVPLRQSTLVIAAVSRVCHIARPAHAPFYSAPDREAEYYDERVCVCVCVCVCLSAIMYSELHVRSSPNLCACYLCRGSIVPLAA